MADLEHNKKYLALFREKVTQAQKKPTVQELYSCFKGAFPKADKNLEFFLGHLSNQFGEGGQIWVRLAFRASFQELGCLASCMYIENTY